MRYKSSLFSVVVRSTIFNCIFYPWTTIAPLALLLRAWLCSSKTLQAGLHYYKSVSFLEKHILGLTYEVLGQENVPPGPCIIALKHQSFWENLKLLNIVEDPVFVYKEGVSWLPGYGWGMVYFGMIEIDRSNGFAAIKKMIKHSKKIFKHGRQLIIFPEGTRALPGQKHPYKRGIEAVYKANTVPVVPVALNSGLNWPKNSFLKYPGKITMKVLKPIPPGLPTEEMLKKLEKMIETESDKLLKC